MVAWFYEHIIVETVDWFCRTALPGIAGDWSKSLYHIVEVPPDEYSGCAYRIDIDIPLNEPDAFPCWLTFTISKPEMGDEERTYVKRLSAVCSSIGEEEGGILTWDEESTIWTPISEGGFEDSHDGSCLGNTM